MGGVTPQVHQVFPIHPVVAEKMTALRCTLHALLCIVAVGSSADMSSVQVSNFAEMESAVEEGTTTIVVAGSQIVFSHPIELDDAALFVEGTTTLSGNWSVTLFFVNGGSKLSLTGVSLVHCVGQYGGAIAVYSNSALVMKSVRVSFTSALFGGAVYAMGSQIVVADCTMTANTADWGGAVAAYGSTVTVTRSTMTSNSASIAGGVFVAKGSSIVTATDCTMTSNKALGGGVIAAFDDSMVTTSNCTMTSNSAQFGGAVHAGHCSTITATNCTMMSNKADWGGAVAAVVDSSVTATSCSILSNSARTTGGACLTLGSAVLTLSDCVVQRNRAVEVRSYVPK